MPTVQPVAGAASALVVRVTAPESVLITHVLLRRGVRDHIVAAVATEHADKQEHYEAISRHDVGR